MPHKQPAHMAKISLCCLSLMLSGCGRLLQKWDNSLEFTVSATPLSLESDWALTSPANPTSALLPRDQSGNVTTPIDVKYAIGSVVYQSERKCSQFLSGLSLHESASETTFDFATTVFNALGTALTPVATVHAFAAAASIASGTRIAIDQDFFARASIANYARAIQIVYSQKMLEYVQGLDKSEKDSLIFPIEFSKIQSIHAACALAPAQSEISNLLTTAAAGSGAKDDATETTKIVVASPAAKPGVILITPSAASGPTLGIVPVAVSQGESVNDIAKAISANLTALLPAAAFVSISVDKDSTSTVDVITKTTEKLRFVFAYGNTGVKLTATTTTDASPAKAAAASPAGVDNPGLPAKAKLTAQPATNGIATGAVLLQTK